VKIQAPPISGRICKCIDAHPRVVNDSEEVVLKHVAVLLRELATLASEIKANLIVVCILRQLASLAPPRPTVYTCSPCAWEFRLESLSTKRLFHFTTRKRSQRMSVIVSHCFSAVSNRS
jgi:hypothetical protein